MRILVGLFVDDEDEDEDFVDDDVDVVNGKCSRLMSRKMSRR